MIASFSHNFIFLKTRKTGGTSAETVLGSWCSGRDIVTPFNEADDNASRARAGGHAMNYRRGWFRKPFHQHQAAAVVKAALPDLWGRAFKFAVERHPYERAISLAYWRIEVRRGDPVAEFERELEIVLEGKRALNNRPIYCIDDAIAVDEVIRYENFWPRLRELAGSLGGEVPELLPLAKTSSRTDRRPAREILTDDQKARLYQLARQDFEQLGFER